MECKAQVRETWARHIDLWDLTIQLKITKYKLVHPRRECKIKKKNHNRIVGTPMFRG